MPTDRTKQGKYPNRPWHARKKYRNIVFHLGYYATREEAVQAEESFLKEITACQ